MCGRLLLQLLLLQLLLLLLLLLLLFWGLQEQRCSRREGGCNDGVCEHVRGRRGICKMQQLVRVLRLVGAAIARTLAYGVF
jgi:hypothetical protein